MKTIRIAGKNRRLTCRSGVVVDLADRHFTSVNVTQYDAWTTNDVLQQFFLRCGEKVVGPFETWNLDLSLRNGHLASWISVEDKSGAPCGIVVVNLTVFGWGYLRSARQIASQVANIIYPGLKSFLLLIGIAFLATGFNPLGIGIGLSTWLMWRVLCFMRITWHSIGLRRRVRRAVGSLSLQDLNLQPPEVALLKKIHANNDHAIAMAS